ncbi:D-alanyl-D-alanine carboxypeptidase family protein [Cognatishimia sp. F0-27]|uniref:D-alanyl-D-alanine carboxypeptidase family protein n=1 Tax=Cognatishimia sp. F0-27 TaxID=2816855 RepID=UPI001D0C0BF3|nr:D-alanyl-D-alanine carboxypeptidase family protein [Cognatishimia sp. F0-27]MCC1494275.1 D-alanyl-D-alanine carboxypeptidase [Cognatishimia sp. F0-27]
MSLMLLSYWLLRSKAGRSDRACRPWVFALTGVMALCLSALHAGAASASAKQAEIVIDTRNGAVYHEMDADKRLHPASLTKMMTLYIAFQALRSGEIAADREVTVSAHAAAQPGSTLGLAEGDRITVNSLVLATALRSANDAATALAEAIAGSEDAFVARMNSTAQAMGLTGTYFRNPHGLTEEDHLSTARDMARLGRYLFFDQPEDYAVFSRRSARIGSQDVVHTNSRFLAGYGGADGLKTGYTRAAGFNLAASARRGDRHLIAVLFGAPNSVARTARASEMMDLGFAAAPEEVPLIHPGPMSRNAAPEDLWIARLDGLSGYGAGSVLAQVRITPESGGQNNPSIGSAATGTTPIRPSHGAIGLGLFSAKAPP